MLINTVHSASAKFGATCQLGVVVKLSAGEVFAVASRQQLLVSSEAARLKCAVINQYGSMFLRMDSASWQPPCA